MTQEPAVKRQAIMDALKKQDAQQSRGPMMRNPTPDWLKPENASVMEPLWKKAVRAVGHVIGADDPNSQVMALLNPMEAGKKAPIRAYHGTTKEFDKFAVGHAPGWGEGIYFTDNLEQAKNEFGHGGRVIRADVDIQNPYNGQLLDNNAIKQTKAWDAIKDQWLDPQDAFQEDSDFVGKVLRELGHDGVVTQGSNGINGQEIVAFKPEQIKIVDVIKKYGIAGALSAGLINESQAKQLAVREEQMKQLAQ